MELPPTDLLRRWKTLYKFQQPPFLLALEHFAQNSFCSELSSRPSVRPPKVSTRKPPRTRSRTSLKFARTSGKDFGNTPSHSWRMDVEKHFLTLYGAEKHFLTWVCWCMNSSHSEISSSTLLNTSEELSHGVWTKFSQPTTYYNTCSNPSIIDPLLPLNICHALHKQLTTHC